MNENNNNDDGQWPRDNDDAPAMLQIVSSLITTIPIHCQGFSFSWIHSFIYANSFVLPGGCLALCCNYMLIIL